MTAYLQELTLKLGAAVGELAEEQRQIQSTFFLQAQQADGGFMGREGESDLYYTGFATRALAILGELHGDPAERLASFLTSRIQGQETVIDFLSLAFIRVRSPCCFNDVIGENGSASSFTDFN